MNKSNVTALVLSGGQSSRMSGKDKGLLLLRGEPLISYVINAISGNVDSILVSANRNIDSYQKFGNVITDNLSEFQGPLAGILAALDVVSTEYLLVLPCDSPFVNSVIIHRLESVMKKNSCDICVASDGKKMQPVFSLLRSSLRDNLSDYLGTGERKLGAWYESNEMVKVDFSDHKEMFININTKEDLKKFQ